MQVNYQRIDLLFLFHQKLYNPDDEEKSAKTTSHSRGNRIVFVDLIAKSIL
jgi:hypothetical protein